MTATGLETRTWHDKNIQSIEFLIMLNILLLLRLEQADLVWKIDFDNKLTSFNKRIISNKTKLFFWTSQNKLNSLITKDYDLLSKHVFL